MQIRTLNNNKENNDEVKGKVIRKAQIARQLLQRGQKIIDIKGDRADPDGKRSVFVFEDSDEFQEAFSAVLEENRNKHTDPETADLKKRLEEMQKKLDALESDNKKEE